MKKIAKISVLMVFSIVFLTACNLSPLPSISSEEFCSSIDEQAIKCVDAKDTFGKYDKIFFIFHISDYPTDTVFTADWFYDSGKAILSSEITIYGSRNVVFFITPGSSWKETGGFVNLLVDGNLYKSYFFDIN